MCVCVCVCAYFYSSFSLSRLSKIIIKYKSIRNLNFKIDDFVARECQVMKNKIKNKKVYEKKKEELQIKKKSAYVCKFAQLLFFWWC